MMLLSSDNMETKHMADRTLQRKQEKARVLEKVASSLQTEEKKKESTCFCFLFLNQDSKWQADSADANGCSGASALGVGIFEVSPSSILITKHWRELIPRTYLQG